MAASPRLYHYTLMFHTFVLMNLFNQINCRKLGLKDFNIFERFINNFWFIAVLAGEFVAQWFIVEIGGVIFRTTSLPLGLHLVALCLGAGSLAVGAALKFIPEELVDRIPVVINEEAGDEGVDILSKMHKRVVGHYQKSETQRLLDDSQ